MTIDTNIVIGYLNGDKGIIKQIKEWRVEERILIIPTIVESEVLSFSGLSLKEQRVIERFIEENFISVAYDRQIAHIAARLRRETKIKFPDAGIAATAIFTHTPIVTKNVKDFRRITGLEVINI